MVLTVEVEVEVELGSDKEQLNRRSTRVEPLPEPGLGAELGRRAPAEPRPEPTLQNTV